MMYKTHILGGILFSSAAITVLNINPTHIPLVITCGIIGSLIPDLDHKNSYLGSRFKITSSILNTSLGHRGATHSPIITGIIMYFLYFIISQLGLSFNFINLLFMSIYIGILSHIMLDSLNPMGVPLFYPFTKKKISFTKIKTNSFGEKIVFFMLIGLIMIKYGDLIRKII